MKRLLALFCFLALQVCAATNQWEGEIARFEASDRTNRPPVSAVVFVGSSSIRLWTTLSKDLAPYSVLNRGFGGSDVSDSLHFAERIVIPYRPKLVVMYAGGNDINRGKTPEKVFADFQAFVQKILAALPQTRIAYISVAPNPARWAQVDRVKAVNQKISDYARQHPSVEFVDVFSAMLGADGLPRPEIFVADRLHMNERGYEIWTRILKPRLSEWLKGQ